MSRGVQRRSGEVSRGVPEVSLGVPVEVRQVHGIGAVSAQIRADAMIRPQPVTLIYLDLRWYKEINEGGGTA